MLIDQTIFKLTDVQKVRLVSDNIDDFELYAVEVQRNYLQKILGDKLYTALLSDLDTGGLPQTQRFIDLIDGVIYTDGDDIIFRGVQLYCCYLWLKMYFADSAIAITPIGPMLFKDEHADRNEASKSIRNAEAHYIRAADGLEEPILRFLDSKISDYPEFSQSDRIEQAEADNFEFNVIGRRYDAPNNFIE